MGMQTSVMTAEYRADVQTVWDVVTDNVNFGWRGDISRIEITDANHFVEHTSKGEATRFTITQKEACRLYAFRLENSLLTGDWTGEFTALPNGGTRIVFTERVRIKNPVVSMAARLTRQLRRMQDAYAAALRSRLGE